MKRTPLKRKTPLRSTQAHSHAIRKPKTSPARQAAHGQPCTLRLDCCTNTGVVLCHLRQFGGGGMGMKPHDSEAVFACRPCHDAIDGRMQPAPAWDYEDLARALIRTLRAQREAGVLIYRGES